MVVDDEPDVLSTLKSILEQCPFSYVVEDHTNPRAALGNFRENPTGTSILARSCEVHFILHK
jgi:CheY-like chemotaxis protein